MSKPLRVNTEKFAKLLISLEREGNVSFREIARKTGIHQTTFSKIKSGAIDEIKLSIVGKVCDYLNIDPYEYLESGDHILNLDRLPAELRQEIWTIIVKHAGENK